MWTRRSVKRRGKNAMKKNYWKTVLVSLILATILGGSSAASGVGSGVSSGAAAAGSSAGSAVNQAQQGQSGDIYEGLFSTDDLQDAGTDTDLSAADGEAEGLVKDEAGVIPDLPDEVLKLMPENIRGVQLSERQRITLLIALGIIILIIIAVAVLLTAFLLNPLEVGIRRFFFMNMREPAQIKEIAYGYDNSYRKNVLVLFLRDLFLVFWTLLLIFPGIIKSYSYRMIPYILADHPEMTRKEVFRLSKQLMHGNKWKTFVLDLSFIGWYILSVLTLGILHVFFVAPYKNMTDAALYERLMYGRKETESVPVAMIAEEDDDE